MRKTLPVIALLLAALACNAPTTEDAVLPEETPSPAAATAVGEEATPIPTTVEEEEPTATLEPTPTQLDSGSGDTGGGDTGGGAGSEPDDGNYVAFRDDLIEAIVNRDYTTLQSQLADPFIVAGFQSEGTSYSPPSTAISEVRTNVLPSTGFVNYTLGSNVSALLGGTDPLSLWPADANAVAAIPFSGFGPESDTDALVIVSDEGNVFAWYAVLLVPGGFSDGETAQPTATAEATEEATAEATEEATAEATQEATAEATQEVTATVEEGDLTAEEQNAALDDFMTAMQTYIQNYDYDNLQAIMGASFVILGEPEGLDPEDAIEEFEDELLQVGADIDIEQVETYDFETGEWSDDLSDRLGYAVEDCCGSDIFVVGALRFEGWGESTEEQVVFIVRQTAPGEYVLYAAAELGS